MHPHTLNCTDVRAPACASLVMQVLTKSDVNGYFWLPIHFVRRVDLQKVRVELTTRQGTWQESVIGGKRRCISLHKSAHAGLFSTLQLRPGTMTCITHLGPRRLLLTTESEQQFKAVAADAPGGISKSRSGSRISGVVVSTCRLTTTKMIW